MAPAAQAAGTGSTASAGSDSSGSYLTATVALGTRNGGSQGNDVSNCSQWAPVQSLPVVSDLPHAAPVKVENGETFHLYQRTCGDQTSATWVGETSPRDLAAAAYDEVSKRLPKPEASFSPRIDRQIVNMQTWFAATPIPVQSVDASVPGMWTTVTATPTTLELDTGSIVHGDTTHITCQPWGSTTGPEGGCTWTPTWPSVHKTTGTNDHRYHGTLTITWNITWTSSTGAGGTLDQLATTTPVLLGVGEIQTIGGT